MCLALLGCGVPRGGLDGADAGVADATPDVTVDAEVDARDSGNDARVDAGDDAGPADVGVDAFDGGTDACTPGDDLCDGVDSDCDGTVDEDDLVRSCGVGTACGQACVGGVFEADCTNVDDPSAAEVCINGDDDDCDGMIDENCECEPGATTSCGPCGDGTSTCTPAGLMGACEGGSTPNTWYTDADTDGFGAGAPMTDCDPAMGRVLNDEDCNDACFDCNPLGTEVCDGLDNNCNGVPDEGLTRDFWVDADGDGFGDGTMLMAGCGGPGLVDNPDDCDDSCPECRPGFPIELCDGLDNNCNTTVDEGCIDCFIESTPTNGDYAICDFAVDNYNDAVTACRLAGWDMVKIDDATENAEVWALLDPYDRDFWAGGVEGSGNNWFWADGSALATDCTGAFGCTCVGYCNWLAGEPDSPFANDCARFREDIGGQWADINCTTDMAFVCEIP